MATTIEEGQFVQSTFHTTKITKLKWKIRLSNILV